MVSASNSNIRWLLLPETYYDATATMPFVFYMAKNGYASQVVIGFPLLQTNIMVLILGIMKKNSHMFSSGQENWQFSTIK